MRLTHYIIVRDLPVGVVYAQIAHAAGESFYLCPRSSEKEHSTLSREVAGSSPAGGSTFTPAETIAVVLGARDEARLSRAAKRLQAAGVPFVEIRETDGAFAGQFMAIGVVPCEKALLRGCLNEFQVFRDAPDVTGNPG